MSAEGAPLSAVITAMLGGHDAAIAAFVQRQHHDRLQPLAAAAWALIGVVHQLQWRDTPAMLAWKAPEVRVPVPAAAFRAAVESALANDRAAAVRALDGLTLDELTTTAYVAWTLRHFVHMRLEGRGLPTVLDTEPDPQRPLFGD